MRVTIYTTDGGSVEIERNDDASTLDLLAELQDWDGGTSFLTFQLDDESTTHINRQQIVRVDIDPEPRGADS